MRNLPDDRHSVIVDPDEPTPQPDENVSPRTEYSAAAIGRALTNQPVTLPSLLVHSLMSFALAGPTNDASVKARDRTVADVRVAIVREASSPATPALDVDPDLLDAFDGGWAARGNAARFEQSHRLLQNLVRAVAERTIEFPTLTTDPIMERAFAEAGAYLARLPHPDSDGDAR